MTKNMKLILAAMLLVCSVTVKANASVAVSSASAAGVQAIAAPSSGNVTVIKSLTLSNDTATALCVLMKDGTTFKGFLCAASHSTTVWPPAAPSPGAFSGSGGALSAFLGEDFKVAGAFNVFASTPIANSAGGGALVISYVQK